jgi:thiamine-monophosphate kinase
VTVSELGERALLARIQARLSTAGRRRASLVIGIGDDAAVVAPTRNAYTVLTTDAHVEGVHFNRRFSTAADVGYRALAVNLSDLAAMGATPAWALLSLVLPGALPVGDVDAMVEAGAELGQQFGCEVIGGNLTRSPGPLVVDVTAVGEVRPRRVLTRSGGQPGDELWVSGSVGAAAAGLEMLRSGVMPGLKPGPAGQHRAEDPGFRPGGSAAGPGDSAAGPGFSPGGTSASAGFSPGICIARYLRPEPRVRMGRAMAQARAARAAMDLSDGLSDAAHQMAEASGCGVEVDGDALPIDPAARAWWEALGQDPVLRAMSGGDDYELLFAVPRTWGGRLRHARSRVAEPALTRIGVLTKDPGARVLLRNGARETLPRGFEHF